VDELDGLWGEDGEVLLTEPRATWQDVKALPGWAHIDIVKFSRGEILAKTDGIDLRWTPESGAEIIVKLARRHVFQHVFGPSWGRAGEAKWIGQKGLIFRRYQNGGGKTTTNLQPETGRVGAGEQDAEN
jgi:hypothetical protein